MRKPVDSSIGPPVFFFNLGILPADASFFRSVDLGKLDPFVEKKNLQIVEKKVMRVRVRNIESEMIDKLVLLLKPFLPAALANLIEHPLTQIVRQGHKLHLCLFGTAPKTFEFITTENSHGKSLDSADRFCNGRRCVSPRNP